MDPKKILIDSRYIFNVNGGISDYCKPIIENFEKFSGYDVTFLVKQDFINVNNKYKILREPKISSNIEKIKNSFINPFNSNINFDIFYSPYYDLVYNFKNCKKYNTIHDLAFFDLSLSYKLHVRVYFLFLFIFSFIKCKKVVMINNYEFRRIPFLLRKKVKILKNVEYYNGQSCITNAEILFKIKNHKEIKFIYTGGYEARKNITLLFEFIKLLIEREYQFKFYITGNSDKFIDHLHKIYEPSIMEKIMMKTEFLGFLNDDNLSHYYKESDIVFYPSLYEGYGRVISDAIYYNKFVMCLHLDVYQEFFKDYPIYCSNSAESFVDKFDCLVTENVERKISAEPETSEKFIKFFLELLND